MFTYLRFACLCLQEMTAGPHIGSSSLSNKRTNTSLPLANQTFDASKQR